MIDGGKHGQHAEMPGSREGEAPRASGEYAEREEHDRVAELEQRIAALKAELDDVGAALTAAMAEREDVRARLEQPQARSGPYAGPAISRWRRRRGAGPRGIRVGDDFDDALPEFDDD